VSSGSQYSRIDHKNALDQVFFSAAKPKKASFVVGSAVILASSPRTRFGIQLTN
jgi:hypothetical protein